jgi:hypothetical protein
MEGQSVREWIGTSMEERAEALADLLGLADAIPQGLRPKGGLPLVAKVLAVHSGLDQEGLPHAFGGAIALAYYGEPRTTGDVDVNLFQPVDEWPAIKAVFAGLGLASDVGAEELRRDRETRIRWDRNDIHLFFGEDALHEAMPDGVREVPLGGGTIPIVSPEHLIVRKTILDRPKDWLDIEAALIATSPLDLADALAWVERLAGPEDERVTKLRATIARLAT